MSFQRESEGSFDGAGEGETGKGVGDEEGAESNVGIRNLVSAVRQIFVCEIEDDLTLLRVGCFERRIGLTRLRGSQLRLYLQSHQWLRPRVPQIQTQTSPFFAFY